MIGALNKALMGKDQGKHAYCLVEFSGISQPWGHGILSLLAIVTNQILMRRSHRARAQSRIEKMTGTGYTTRPKG